MLATFQSMADALLGALERQVLLERVRVSARLIGANPTEMALAAGRLLDCGASPSTAHARVEDQLVADYVRCPQTR